MVEAEVGLTVIPRAAKTFLNPYRVRSIPIRPTIDWGLALVWRRGAVPSVAARAWIDVTRDLLIPAPLPVPGPAVHPL